MYPTGYKKAARVLLKITFFIYAVMAVCWGLFGVFCFFDERGYYASSFINGLMQLDFFMDAVAVVSMLGVFLMPLPCLILSVTGSVCAAKAAGMYAVGIGEAEGCDKKDAGIDRFSGLLLLNLITEEAYE